MRINHNIAALNTYNKLTANTAATSKSLEKLSSGLKINKAGDNAAGLAISEKMRGQIRGLDQASTNASDAISLIGTAEGALSETHSILQRMRELAVQSANDTNVTIDRDEIQKEMNQLTSEINRIGNTTEFNTQKLLNGGGIETAVDVNTITAGAGTGGVAGGDTMGTANTSGLSNITVGVLSGLAAGNTASFTFQGATVNFVTTTGTVAAINASTATENSITINLTSGTDVTAASGAILIASGLKAIQAQGGLDDITIAASGAAVTFNAGFTTQLNGATVSSDSGSFATSFTLAATQAGNGIGAGNFDISTLTTSVEGVAQVNKSTALDMTGLASGDTATYTFKGVSVNITFGATASSTAISDTTGSTANLAFAFDGTANDLATAIASAFESIKAQGGSSSAIGDFDFTASTDTILMTAQTKTDAYVNDRLMVSSNGGAAAIGDTVTTAGLDEVRGSYTFSIDTAFEAAGTKINIEGQSFEAVASNATGDQFLVGTDPADQAASLAQAMNSNEGINSRYDVLVDGNKITLTEKAQQANGIAVTQGTITGNVATAGISQFSIDESVAVGGKYEIDDVKIEVTDDATDKGIADGTKVLYSADTTQQATNLANAINANSTLNSKYERATSTGNTIQLKQKLASASMEASEVLTGTNANDGFEANFQIGANTAQSLTVEVNDMRSEALGVAGKTAGGEATAKNGSVASFTATKDITDGTTNTGVEYALDVSTHEKATAAISVINDAIESVSAERSKLGSYQNRLEHTINNLGTSSENLTTAESRIRDVDMAKEMMEFTKNNILSQAAQSMLAQANQQPQGVLQLLQ